MIGEKWVYSFIAGVLFFALASPFLFNITQSIAGLFGFTFITPAGVPTIQGITFHAIVFMLITRVLMG